VINNKTLISGWIVTLLLLIPTWLSAQAPKDKTTRVLFIIDGSSSMLEKWSGNLNRFKAGGELVHQIMDSITMNNPNVEFGLRVFGHNYTVDKNNCLDTRLETPFAPYNQDLLFGRLQLIQPQGVSPIALSLKESAEVDIVNPQKYAYSLILITDGNESCGGDICAVMQRLMNFKIAFKPYIISLNNDKSLVSQYDCMGEFMIVSQPQDFGPVISKILKDNNNFVATHQTNFTPQSSYNPTLMDEISPTPIDTTTTEKPSTPSVAMTTGAFPSPRLRYSALAIPRVDKLVVKNLPTFKFSITEESIPSTPVVTTPTEPTKPAKKWNTVDKVAINTRISTLPYKLSKPQSNLVKVTPLPTFKLPQEPEITRHTLAKMPAIGTELKLLAYKPTPMNINKVKINPLPTFNFPKDPQPTTQSTTQPNTKPQYHSTNTQVDTKNQKSTITTEDKANDQEPGTMQVYLTNGKGKYYNSSPKIIIKNNTTGQIAYEGNREVSQGQPMPITLPDGHYTVTFALSGRSAPVVIEKGKNKRVEVVVGNGNIAFAYTGTNEIPQGYVATISKRFEPGDIITHPSEIKLQYEPANYHIEINTLPILMYNVDVEADGLVLVNIPRPGHVQIMNEEELGRIEFWHVLAGQTYRFYEMSIYGDVEYQQVEFRPGKYEVRYPFVTSGGERVMKVKTFNLESKQQLKLLLD